MRIEALGELVAVGRTRGPRGGSGRREGALASAHSGPAGSVLCCLAGLRDLDLAREVAGVVDAAATALLTGPTSAEALSGLARDLGRRVREEDAGATDVPAIGVAVVTEGLVRWLRIGETTLSVLGRSPGAMRVRTATGTAAALRPAAIAGPVSMTVQAERVLATALQGAVALKRGSWVVLAAGAPIEARLPGRPRTGCGRTADPEALTAAVLAAAGDAEPATTVTAAAHAVPVSAPLPQDAETDPRAGS